VDLNCSHWANHATELLRHLATDINLALKIKHGDETILQHILLLIEFLINCCSARQDLESSFSKLSERKKKKTIAVRGSQEKKYSDIKASLTKLTEHARNAQARLLNHLLDLKTNISGTIVVIAASKENNEDSKIPTMTLRELFLLNKAY
jgi:hypothetical protein